MTVSTLPAVTPEQRMARARANAEHLSVVWAKDWQQRIGAVGLNASVEDTIPLHGEIEDIEGAAALALPLSHFLHGLLSLSVYPYERENGRQTRGKGLVRAYAENVAGINERTLYEARCAASSKWFDGDILKFTQYLLEPMEPGSELPFHKVRPWYHVTEMIGSNWRPEVLPAHLRAEMLAHKMEQTGETFNKMEEAVARGDLDPDEAAGVIATAAETMTKGLEGAQETLQQDRPSFADWCAQQPCVLSKIHHTDMVLFDVMQMEIVEPGESDESYGVVPMRKDLAKAAAGSPDPFSGIEQKYGVNIYLALAGCLANYIMAHS